MLVREVMAQCPVCKASDTIDIVHGWLVPSMKYHMDQQRNVYHCGDIPCKLFLSDTWRARCGVVGAEALG